MPIVSAQQYSLKSVSPPETPGVVWEQSFGGPYGDCCFDLIEVGAGGYVLTGYTDSAWFGKEGKIWLVRLDSEGEQLWNHTYRYVGYPEESLGSSVLECTDGGFAIAGYLEGYENATDSHYVEMLLVRTDSEGNQLWNSTYGYGVLSNIVQCSDGGFALFGSKQRISVIDNDDFYLARTDSEGTLLWNYTYGGSEADRSSRLVLCSDGGFAMLGTSSSFGSDFDFLLVRTDSSGHLLWYQTYGGTGFHHGDCLLQTDSGFIIAGEGPTGGPLIIRTDTDGHMVSKNEFLSHAGWHRFSAVGFAECMIRCGNGGYIIAGSGTDSALEDGAWLLRIDDGGFYLWDNFYSQSRRDVFQAIIESSEGGFLVAGLTTVDWDTGDTDVWIMRVADQPIVPTYRLAAGVFGVSFAFILGAFVIRRRERWPGL
jgi:hypothetical protein